MRSSEDSQFHSPNHQSQSDAQEADVLRPRPFYPHQKRSTLIASAKELREWYANLAPSGKVLVGAGVVIFGLMLISIMLQLLAIALRLALVVLVGVMVYRYLIRPWLQR